MNQTTNNLRPRLAERTPRFHKKGGQTTLNVNARKMFEARFMAVIRRQSGAFSLKPIPTGPDVVDIAPVVDCGPKNGPSRMHLSFKKVGLPDGDYTPVFNPSTREIDLIPVAPASAEGEAVGHEQTAAAPLVEGAGA